MVALVLQEVVAQTLVAWQVLQTVARAGLVLTCRLEMDHNRGAVAVVKDRPQVKVVPVVLVRLGLPGDLSI